MPHSVLTCLISQRRSYRALFRPLQPKLSYLPVLLCIDQDLYRTNLFRMWYYHQNRYLHRYYK